MPPRARAVVIAALAAALPATAAAQGAAPSIPVEVFGGYFRPAAELGAGDLDVLGVRAGLDVGGYTGVRGFYWRSVRGDGAAQAFGAEAQLNLNAARGVTPFLVGGVARLDHLEGTDGALPTAEDRTMPLVGGGLRLEVGRFAVQGALRSYLAELAPADDPDRRDLRHSTLWTAGAAFRLGRRARPAPRAAAVPAPSPAPAAAALPSDTAAASEEYASERLVTIPIPREGEIYLRYGPAGESRGPAATAVAADASVDDAALARLRRQIVADLEPLLRGMAAADREEVAGIVRREIERSRGPLAAEEEQRLLERIDAVVALRVREELARVAPAGDTSLALVPAPAPAAADSAPPRFQPRFGALRPYAGGNLDRPRQFVAGVRLDLGPIDPARPQVRLVPEAALGIGQAGNSVMLAANVAYEATPLSVRGAAVQPYGYVGAGFLFLGNPAPTRPKTEAVVNFGYGLFAPVPNWPAEFFLEHQGIDLFDLNRVLVGVRF